MNYFTFIGEGRSPRLSLRVLIEDLVHGDQCSNDICHWFEAREEVLIVSQPIPHREAFNILGLHICGRLGHHQHNDRSSTDAALDCRPDQHPCIEEALLPMPRWSMHEVRQDVGSAAEGLHLREQPYSKQMPNIRHHID
jgi:hypothetical protein